MKLTRSIELTFEKCEKVVVHHRRVVAVWCDHCGQKIRMMRPEKSADITKKAETRKIDRSNYEKP